MKDKTFSPGLQGRRISSSQVSSAPVPPSPDSTAPQSPASAVEESSECRSLSTWPWAQGGLKRSDTLQWTEHEGIFVRQCFAADLGQMRRISFPAAVLAALCAAEHWRAENGDNGVV
eukprot:scaffold2489_cov259-Pinguiococcus_pyrenoidosus.AAC.9